jgi:hypothetical protein
MINNTIIFDLNKKLIDDDDVDDDEDDVVLPIPV